MFQPIQKIPTSVITRDARPEDAEDVHRILNECASWLSERGMKHWLGFHTGEWVEEAMKKMKVRIAERAIPLGIVMFREGTTDDLRGLDFRAIQDEWNPGITRHLWISKLAVSPDCHCSGIGSALLKDAELSAKGLNHKVARLDAVKCFIALRAFYEKRGYTVVGEHHNCFVYEKLLRLGREDADNWA